MSIEILKKIEREVIELRHAIHKEPELSGEENETRKKIIRFFETFEIYEIKKGHAGSLIVDITSSHNDSSALVIGIRGDMDALPINEERDDLSYQSQNKGVMHACGHDTHTAIAAGVAAYFNNKKDLNGAIRIIFQPSEECEPLGGREVVKEGWIDNVDIMLGIHAYPSLPSGTVGIINNHVTASADTFSIIFSGQSAHGAFPHEGTDTIFIASAFIQLLQGLVTRQTDANENSIVSIGVISGGTAENIVCDRTEIKGTIRTHSTQGRYRLQNKIKNLANDLAKSHGAKSTFTLLEGEPAVFNDPKLLESFKKSTEKIIGKNKVKQLPPLMGSDDFGFYSQKTKSLYFFYGTHNLQYGHIHPLHTSKFGVADQDMILGLKLIISAAEEFLNSQKKG
ncbi:amidohydrolase [Halomonas sp. FME1]|uniref:Amidohydrolase n=1 Tax=Halomonas casei TaxID=2742613 RepID=A0ABR9EZ88_9GAMM|nr:MULTISPECIES: amidohydrolase [Halomonas]MBE0399525.1 amidohydrolase [Halomonas casei]PCC23463.1 hypothetical protein CIK78_16170 [Halomonas sp. JB37]